MNGKTDPTELRGELDRFKVELRAAGLRESTVHSYLVGSRLFVRWLDDDYVPARSQQTRPAGGAMRRDARPVGDAQALQCPSLTLKEREVLNLRKGLEGDGPYSRGEIAQRLDITATRVAELEEQAVKKLASERNATIAIARKQGDSLQAIANRFGMSRERVRQILANQ